jgi:hypothetical protein
MDNLPQHMDNLPQHMGNLRHQPMDNLQHQPMDNLQLPMDNCRLVLLSTPLRLTRLRLQCLPPASILHLSQINISPLQRPTRPLLLIKLTRTLGCNLSKPNLLHFSRPCLITTYLQAMAHRTFILEPM